MTNTELIAKIKAEIEKLKTFYGELHTDFVCEALLSFLSTLESKNPVPNDPEEEARTLYPYKEGYDVDLPYPSTYDENEEARNAFIAGAEWQYQKDRGKFAQIKAKTWSEGFDACKEQMLKGAVEGAVFGTADDHWVETEIDKKLSYVSPGDKVSVIIIKKY